MDMECWTGVMLIKNMMCSRVIMVKIRNPEESEDLFDTMKSVGMIQDTDNQDS